MVKENVMFQALRWTTAAVFVTILASSWQEGAAQPGGPSVEVRPQIDRDKLPGRQVRVATIAIGYGGDRDKKLKLALEHLHVAGKRGVDIACLPEEFAGTKAEPLDGPTVQACAALARQYHMYVVTSVREQAGDEQFNTAVLIDRQGKTVGYYRKVFVFWGEGCNVSREGVKTFDCDFGRVAMLTCFDANFAELWLEADKKGADVVLWPSAYGGGQVLNAYAMAFGYCVVAVGWGNVIDAAGVTVSDVKKPMPKQAIATLDLDRTFVHYDFTGKKIERLLAENKGKVEMKRWGMESWYELRATAPGVRVRDLCRQYEIEPLRDYRHRSREQINQARKEGKRI